MLSINEVLTHVLYGTQNWKLYLVTNWPTIVGPLSLRMHIEKIEEDIIVVGVHDSCWLQELSMLSEILLCKINQSLPGPYLKKIKFRHASHLSRKHKKEVLPNIQPRVVRPLSHQERCALQAIGDQELSDALYQFLVRCQQTTVH